MELHLEQQHIPSFELRAQCRAEERFSTDCVIPDALPDASSLLLSEGELCLWRLDLNDGAAELEGEINARVCFREEKNEISGFPVNIPITVHFRDEDLERGLRPLVRCRLVELTSQLINSRKIRLQGRLLCELNGYAPRDLLLTSGVGNGEKGLFQRSERTVFSVVSAVEEQVFTASETVSLRQGYPEDGRLLSSHSLVVLDETQLLDRRVILHGRVVTALLYRDAQGENLISETVETSFSQMIDVASEQPLSSAEAVLHLTSEEIQCRNDEQAVETEFHLVAQVVCCSRVETECVSDAYSTRGKLILSWSEEQLPDVAVASHRNESDGIVSCNPAGNTVAAARAALRGDRVEVTLLLSDESGNVSALSEQLSLPESAQGLLMLEQPEVSPCKDGFSVRVPALFREAQPPAELLHQIAGAEFEPMDEADQRPSIKLVRREEKDLWTLAKTHSSSVEAIRAANPETETPARWILIPRVI